MKSFTYTIQDAEGVHARPAGILCKACKAMAPNKVTVTKGEETAECNKIFALMSLGIKCGDEVTFTVEGPDEDAKLSELREIVLSNL